MVRVETVIAANRFGLGARPGDLERIDADPRGWLHAQLTTAPAVAKEIRALESSAHILATFQGRFRDRIGNRNRDSDRESIPTDIVREFAGGVREDLITHYLAQVQARVVNAVHTDAPFHDRLVHFWTNHFAVSADKPPVTGLAGALENEVIRPRVTGYFHDLLLAVESHPAMITYLDNQRSIGPQSTLGNLAARRRRNREVQIGINENLGREILELHTLGVDGGYTQADVIELAKALTGWSLGGNGRRFARGEPGAFAFQEAIHESGARKVLGRRYPEAGIGQAQAILRDLARHPATARHIATKLARHFIADDPPADVIERLADRFRASEGYLPHVHAALIEEPQAWRAAPAKFKTPADFLLSALRAIDFVPDRPAALVAFFDTLGQRVYVPGSPAGWPDQRSFWDGADALLKRIDWSIAVGERIGALYDPISVAADALGPLLTASTMDAVNHAASTGQGLALLLASPEFQRR